MPPREPYVGGATPRRPSDAELGLEPERPAADAPAVATARPAVFVYPGEEYLLGAELGQAPPPAAPAPVPTDLPATIDAWRAARAPHVAAVREGMQDKARAIQAQTEALRPLRERLLAELDRELPEPPEPPESVPPPSRAIRPFLENAPGESPWMVVQRALFGLSTLAQLAGAAFARYPQGALASLTGALQGWAQGQRESGDRAFETWKAQMDSLHRAYERRRNAYRDLLDKHGYDLERLRAALGTKAAELGERREVVDALLQGDLTALELIDKEYQLAVEGQRWAADLALKKDLADAQLALRREMALMRWAQFQALEAHRAVMRRIAQQALLDREVKPYRETLEKMSFADQSLTMLLKAYRDLQRERPDLLPQSGEVLEQWRGRVMRALSPNDPKLIVVTQLSNPVWIGAVDRGLFDERGVRALAAFEQQVAMAHNPPPLEAVEQLVATLQESMRNRARVLASVAASEHVAAGQKVEMIVNLLFPEMQAVPPEGEEFFQWLRQ